jgi:hypothetical protein
LLAGVDRSAVIVDRSAVPLPFIAVDVTAAAPDAELAAHSSAVSAPTTAWPSRKSWSTPMFRLTERLQYTMKAATLPP